MKKFTAKQRYIWFFAAVLVLTGRIFFSPPSGAMAQTVTDTPTATATATATATGTATPTATVTGTQTVTGTVTPGTPTMPATLSPVTATRTPTVRVLVPATGGDLSRPSVLGETAGTGTFVAIWLIGLLLVGYGLWVRKSRR